MDTNDSGTGGRPRESAVALLGARDGSVHVEMATRRAQETFASFRESLPDAARMPLSDLLRDLRAHCSQHGQRYRLIDVEQGSPVAYVVIS